MMNPVGYPPKITPKPMAPRLESLDGKTVYLVDCPVRRLGPVSAPGAGLVRRAHALGEDEVRRNVERLHQGRSQDLGEIKANGDAAIIGVGH